MPAGWLLMAHIDITIEQADIEDRTSFKPERWEDIDSSATDFNYIPFGAGPRVCLGREYAKLFLRVFAVCILQNFDVELLNVDPEMVSDPILRPKDSLPAIFKHKA